MGPHDSHTISEIRGANWWWEDFIGLTLTTSYMYGNALLLLEGYGFGPLMGRRWLWLLSWRGDGVGGAMGLAGAVGLAGRLDAQGGGGVLQRGDMVRWCWFCGKLGVVGED